MSPRYSRAYRNALLNPDVDPLREIAHALSRLGDALPPLSRDIEWREPADAHKLWEVCGELRHAASTIERWLALEGRKASD